VKTIGLLGGMSWESTVSYYQEINRTVRERLGGLHSARLILYSMDFAEVERLQCKRQWGAAGELLAAAAVALEAGGAECLVLCTNTMHIVAPRVEAAVSIPLLHIAEATAEKILESGLRTVGLLGTRFTMEEAFYKGRLERHGLRVAVPPASDRALVDRVIYEELCRGRILESSRRDYCRIVSDLAGRGSEAIILGCTEIGLLLRRCDVPLPLFDTTLIHARAAVVHALEENAASR
jgi:aspartate racemase